jgi:hypothetical protein
MTRAATLAAAALLLAACGNGTDGLDDPAAQDPPPEEAPDDAPPDDADGAPEADASPDTPMGPGDVEVNDPWIGPPQDEIGADAAVVPLAVEGEDAVVAVRGMTVHTEGLTLEVAVRYDPDGDGPQPDDDPAAGGPMDLPVDEDGTSPDELPDEVLRLEVTTPDGTIVATETDPMAMPEPGEEPDEPTLQPTMGTGDPLSWDQQLWLWPRPELADDGLEVTFDWPSQDIDGETVDVEVDGFDAAVDRVVTVWDAEDR